MHVLTVCYGHPADPAAFDAYYTSTHAPLAEKIPGMASFTYRHCESLDGSQPPYYLIAELSFPSREAMKRRPGLAREPGRGRRRAELRHRRRHHVRRLRLSQADTSLREEEDHLFQGEAPGPGATPPATASIPSPTTASSGRALAIPRTGQTNWL